MFRDLLNAVKIRAVAVFLLIHLGLVLGIYALARAAALNGWDQTACLFLGAVGCLYMGFVLAIFFVLWPLLPWIRRARKVEHWTERVMRDLPYFIEQLPKIVAAVQTVIAAWKSATAKPEEPKSKI
jgi:Flp pilus assembly protein TadB